jgi:hypothetical protein
VRPGFITDLLSKPILVGYTFGATLLVIGNQVLSGGSPRDS